MKAEIDFSSGTWAAVRQHAERRIDQLRRRNDGAHGALSAEQTASLRGSIATLKEILALETAPEIVADE